MAGGKPTVGTRVGGIPSVIADGETGLLVPVRDSWALADALSRLLTQPRLARQMGEAGRRRVEAEFSMPVIAAKFAAVYEDLLTGADA